MAKVQNADCRLELSSCQGVDSITSTKQEGAVMAGKFVLKKNLLGKYHFVLKAGNGEIIAQSETYNSKSAAKNGIESVRENAKSTTVEDETGE